MASAQQTVLITGCSAGGIGHALALTFHKRGLRVFATARDTSTMTDLSAAGIETLALDVTDETSISGLRARLPVSTLDILVHNAGRNYTMPALDVELSEVRETFETNVFAVMRLTQALAPMLVDAAAERSKASSRDRHVAPPTILIIGSIAALMPYVFGSAYNASKAAVHAWAAALRVELAPFGVRVVVAVTGGVRSRIARHTRALPRESLYLPIESEYGERQVHSQTVGIAAEEYAKDVVEKVLRPGLAGNEGGLAVWRAQREIWAGARVGLVWVLSMFFPRRIMDWAFARMFKLEKLKASLGKRRD